MEGLDRLIEALKEENKKYEETLRELKEIEASYDKCIENIEEARSLLFQNLKRER